MRLPCPLWTVLIIVAGLGAILFSCKEDEPFLPAVPTIQLTAKDASCTEAWLRIVLLQGVYPRTVTLKRDTLTVFTATLTESDTTIMDEGLLPNRSYTYTLTRPAGAFEERAMVSIRTLDTTSHSFTWQADTLGEGFTNVLNDVAILNDTLAYAVGEMYLRDSTGQIDPQAWNAAKWNGQRWELKRIPFIGPCSAVLYPPLKAIWVFSATNILVTNGGSIVRFDGINATMDCGMNPLLAGAINKIYGVSPQDVYAVGDVGTIVHYANGTWQRIESGTRETINDVWGGSNPLLGDNVVVMAVGSRSTIGESKFIRIRRATGQLDSISWPLQSWPRYSVWFDQRSRVFTCGGGVFMSGNNGWQMIPQLSSVFTNSIRGSGPNNVVVGGDFGLLAHFNGASWQVYTDVGGGSYKSVAVRGNLIMEVGWLGSRAFTLVGRR